MKAVNDPCRRDLKDKSAKNAASANFNAFVNIFPYSAAQRLNQPVNSMCCLGLVLVLLQSEADSINQIKGNQWEKWEDAKTGWRSAKYR